MLVLVIDDEPAVREVVRRAMAQSGYECLTAPNGAEALALVPQRDFDLIFCDVLMEGLSGFDLLRKLRGEMKYPGEIILMTGQASVETAIDAIEAGATDFIAKPFRFETIQQMAAACEQRRYPPALMDVPSAAPALNEIRGRSPAMIEVVKTIMRVAPTDMSVVITGESGVGKELVAHLIHRKSGRAGSPFIALNCGALPDSLLESELFGHAKGAFTGADMKRRGVFEEANGGTIFLDEVAETSEAFQVRLLRVLQEREVTPLGSTQARRINVRVIAASNRDLGQLVEGKSFRQDLLYRLQGVVIEIPPLRNRREDITMMAMSFLAQYAPKGKGLRISREALEAIEKYHWPGNVRELKHAMQKLAILTPGDIHASDLPPEVTRASTADTLADQIISEADWPTLEELKHIYTQKVLARVGDNRTQAAAILGVSRKTVGLLAEEIESRAQAAGKHGDGGVIEEKADVVRNDLS